ncbi:hypothetical protein DFJ74DRAFT_33131 [Hyaloraphidium curvatum]|nr:hypothetical protein DFJ74DRAFT_33131 [Hyaloraphidium curvatum]
MGCRGHSASKCFQSSASERGAMWHSSLWSREVSTQINKSSTSPEHALLHLVATSTWPGSADLHCYCHGVELPGVRSAGRAFRCPRRQMKRDPKRDQSRASVPAASTSSSFPSGAAASPGAESRPTSRRPWLLPRDSAPLCTSSPLGLAGGTVQSPPKQSVRERAGDARSPPSPEGTARCGGDAVHGKPSRAEPRWFRGSGRW